jgi:hypothetical protein
VIILVLVWHFAFTPDLFHGLFQLGSVKLFVIALLVKVSDNEEKLLGCILIEELQLHVEFKNVF